MLGRSFFCRGLTRICLICDYDGGDGMREGEKKDERESLTSTNTRVA